MGEPVKRRVTVVEVVKRMATVGEVGRRMGTVGGWCKPHWGCRGQQGCQEQWECRGGQTWECREVDHMPRLGLPE